MTRLTIAMTGDIYPTRALAPVPAASQPVYDILRQADITIGNFEIPLCRGGSPVEKLLNIRADPDVARDLHVLGLDVVTLANNHAVDYGWSALAETIGHLREADIRVIGAGGDIREAMRPEIVTAKGRRVGMIAFSCLLPTGMSASAERPGIAPLHVSTAYEIDPYYQMEEPGDISVVKVRTEVQMQDLARAQDAVRALDAQCDMVVVSLHWGFGSGEMLAEYQLPLAQALIDAGADIIHGHHPHAVHAVGFHRGKPIFFSMNVLIGQQVFLAASDIVKALWADMSGDGYVARVTLLADGEMEVEAIPTILTPDRLPVAAAGADFERIRARLARLSAKHGGLAEMSGARLLLRAAA